MRKNPEPRPRVLILGASGLLGSRISKNLASSFEVYQHSHSVKAHSTINYCNINLQDFADTFTTLKSLNPKIVINCAAMTDIEKCERLPEASWLINTFIAMNLAKVCAELQIKFIQISTDHIVCKTHVRNENATYYGINQYGCSKLQADNFIIHNNDNSIVIRSNFFGSSPVSKKSFLDAINFSDFHLPNETFDRTKKTLVISKYLAHKNVDFIRVHDVKETLMFFN